MSNAIEPTLLQGGRVVDPASGHDGVADILIGADGHIVELAPGLADQCPARTQIVDVSGRLVVPGFVDLHTHLREPGHEYKETVETGSASAVAGGFTTILCMANTNPVNDNGAVTRYIVSQSEACGLARVLPIGALSHGMEGKKLAEIGDMLANGAVAVSDDGLPVMDAHLMRRALEYCAGLGVPVIAHEEDTCLSGGCMNEGRVSTLLGLRGIPDAAEDVLVSRDIILAELTGGHLHVAHVSTAGAVRLIREAQARGVHVTTEVTPHHFTLTDEAVVGYDPDTRMAPPLRSEEARQAVVEGLRDGTICCIATDHAPHSTIEKEVEFELSACGVVGLETAWGLTYRLVQQGELDLMTAVRLLTSGPSQCFGLKTGTLGPGVAADLVVIDLDASTPVEVDEFHSRSRNSPFKGWELPSRIERTLFGGRTVYLWDGAEGRVGAEATAR
ncbi:MAG: dihydroorotase [Rickettsiales bacterium]|nr:dihydroorotase [Rickettsiales bacterium]